MARAMAPAVPRAAMTAWCAADTGVQLLEDAPAAKEKYVTTQQVAQEASALVSGVKYLDLKTRLQLPGGERWIV